MSLWCGSCRSEIFQGFGILYQLERDDSGHLRFPNKAKDYVPANSAVCDHCWELLPAEEKQTGAQVQAQAESSGETVFIYALADSSPCLVGSKSWSGIVSSEEHFVFVQSAAVAKFFPRALAIIQRMRGEARNH